MRRDPVREAVVRYVAAALAATVAVGLVGVWLFRRAGEAEAIRDAKAQTRLAAESVEPALRDALLRGEPQALSALDRVVQERVLSDPSIARVKLWDASGRIVYSDEPRLIGSRYAMDPHDLAEFEEEGVSAEISDLSKPENRFERPFGRLLEVYLAVRTPSGRPLRYETYYRSGFISSRAGQITREFAPALVGAVVLLALIQLPLAWWLARRVRRGLVEQERLLRRAVEASDLERRRIARDLHDGVVQDLAAVSYSLAAAAETAPAPFDAELRAAAAETRQGIGQLRNLLVEIYPPELHRAGLEAALGDLASAARARGIEATPQVAPDVRLSHDQQALFFRVAQEAVRNAVRHSGASRVRVEVAQADGRARLLVEDDGRGFDPAGPRGEGHLGLRLLEDLVRDSGGELRIDAAPGHGVRVAVEVET